MISAALAKQHRVPSVVRNQPWISTEVANRSHLREVTATNATNLFTATESMPWGSGERIVYTTTNTLPSGLSTNTWYYVINNSGDTFQVSNTSSGSVVEISTDGIGTHSARGGYPGDWQSGIYNSSWAATMTPVIDDIYNAGFRVFFIHRPFGEGGNAGGLSMKFDSRSLCEEKFTAGENHLQTEFITWVSDIQAAYPELHLVLYMGSTHLSSSMTGLSGDASAWDTRFRYNLGPAINNKKIHVFQDYLSSTNVTPSSKTATYYKDFCKSDLWANNQIGGCESIPRLTQTHLHDLWSLSVEGGFINRLNESGDDERYFRYNSVVRWQNRAAWYNSNLWRGVNGLNDFITDCRNYHTIPLIDHTLIDWGLTSTPTDVKSIED